MRVNAFLFLLLTVPTTLAQDAPKGAEYFPLKEGSSWTYTAQGKQFVTKVTGTETVDKEKCFVLETRRDKGLVSIELVAVRKDGVYRVRFAGKDVKEPLCFLRFPIKTGENWKFESKIGEQDVKGGFTFGEAKDVQVEAGKYNTVTVTSKDMKIDGQPVTITYYFAEKVGMVKQTIGIGTTTFEMELKKYEEK